MITLDIVENVVELEVGGFIYDPTRAELAIVNANTATSNANAATSSANTAASSANAAATVATDLIINFQTGTTYTIQASDKGKVIDLSNTATVAVTVPNDLPQYFSCLIAQSNTGQVSFVMQGGATMRQASGLSKIRAKDGIVQAYVRTNSTGTNADWVFSGDMA